MPWSGVGGLVAGDLVEEFLAAVLQLLVLGEVLGAAGLGFIKGAEGTFDFAKLLVEVLALGAGHGSSPGRDGIREQYSALSTQYSVLIFSMLTRRS